MPFIMKDARFMIDLGVPPKTPGEMCYLEYCKIMREWHEEPRWTTVHNIFKELLITTNKETAQLLAFFVFFDRVVMPYERKKIEENGDIL